MDNDLKDLYSVLFNAKKVIGIAKKNITFIGIFTK